MSQRSLFFKLNLFLLFFIALIPSSFAQSIVINEIMSSNGNSIQDEDGDYSDWLEIINPTDSIIPLLNFTISDDINNLHKWTFPDIFIEPQGILILFCSGKNKVDNQLHTNFKIDALGENLWLCNSSNEIIDHVDSVEIPVDVSLGRELDNFSNWSFFSPSTPGSQNNSISYNGMTDVPSFSLSAGFYNSSILLDINSAIESKTYYTIDGSEPNINSTKFEQPFEIDKTTVVRAKSFEDGLLPSKTISSTFFIDEESTIPVISLSTDAKNFFDDEIGIYVAGTNGIPGNCSDEPRNWNRDWERPIHIEYFEENGNLGFSIDAGVKIHGGCTRITPQKSLTIMARSIYGSKSIPYPIFENRSFKNYNSILLRNAGGDYHYTFLRDPIMHYIIEELDIEKQAYKPAIVFLNGNYWGIHNIRERINKEYILQYHDIDPEKIDILEGSGIVKEGDSKNYLEMYNFLKYNDLSIDSNYNYIASQMEIQNYISYLITEMYSVNLEWFPPNMKYWRSNTLDGKWRWIFYDSDRGLGLYDRNKYDYNMFSIITDPIKPPSLIYNKLILNDEFKINFINTFADLSNSYFLPENIYPKIDEYYYRIYNEMPRHIEKWGINGNDLSSWSLSIEDVKYFINNRLSPMRKHFIEQFQLDSTVSFNLNVNNYDGGKIKINSIVPESFPWSGTYFNSIPITLNAIAEPGYSFLRWIVNDTLFLVNEEVEIIPESDIKILAEFKNDFTGKESIVINEINYNSNSNINCGDWVELFNRSDSTINLSDWIISDGNNENQFLIPKNTTLQKHEYLVICNDSLSFKKLFPNVYNFIGGINFKFSSQGELIRLYNKSLLLIDSVRYSPLFPWPPEANGEGKTLELFDPREDNYLANNWRGSRISGGTPGSTNSVILVENLFINEFMAINDSSIVDESNENEDWIEIYNKNDNPILLDNVYITDNLDNLLKHKLVPDSANLSIDPKSFYLFWADQDTLQGIFHLGFKLSGTGEELGISLFNGIEELIIDSVRFLQQYSNQSFGRFPDAYKRWVKFETPTPGDYNSSLDNHSPYFTSESQKEYFIVSDSLISINVWEYIEDVETPDSSIIYLFSSSSDFIKINYIRDEGILKLNVSRPEEESENKHLYMHFEDSGGLFINDTLVFNFPTIVHLDKSEIIPKVYSLSQNYPNPFNPSTKIKFGLPKECKVSLVIYNSICQEVTQLVNQQLKAGYHEIEFNNSNYSSGIYFYRMNAGKFIQTKKMILLK